MQYRINDTTIQEAEFLMGFLFENGFGMDKDPRKAIKYYEKSGMPQALNRIGEIYFTGKRISCTSSSHAQRAALKFTLYQCPPPRPAPPPLIKQCMLMKILSV